jgi:hypothetical protein
MKLRSSEMFTLGQAFIDNFCAGHYKGNMQNSIALNLPALNLGLLLGGLLLGEYT